MLSFCPKQNIKGDTGSSFQQQVIRAGFVPRTRSGMALEERTMTDMPTFIGIGSDVTRKHFVHVLEFLYTGRPNDAEEWLRIES